MPKNSPQIVTVPRANYIAVRGQGDPNEESGAYLQAIGVLYAVAYTLKMSYKTDHRIEGFLSMSFRPWRTLSGKMVLPVLITPTKPAFTGSL